MKPTDELSPPLDLSFLSAEEERAIRQVLQRDETLRKQETGRIRRLELAGPDQKQLKVMSGQWFEEIRAKRYGQQPDVTVVVRSSMRLKQKPAPRTNPFAENAPGEQRWELRSNRSESSSQHSSFDEEDSQIPQHEEVLDETSANAARLLTFRYFDEEGAPEGKTPFLNNDGPFGSSADRGRRSPEVRDSYSAEGSGAELIIPGFTAPSEDTSRNPESKRRESRNEGPAADLWPGVSVEGNGSSSENQSGLQPKRFEDASVSQAGDTPEDTSKYALAEEPAEDERYEVSGEAPEHVGVDVEVRTKKPRDVGLEHAEMVGGDYSTEVQAGQPGESVDLVGEVESGVRLWNGSVEDRKASQLSYQEDLTILRSGQSLQTLPEMTTATSDHSEDADPVGVSVDDDEDIRSTTKSETKLDIWDRKCKPQIAGSDSEVVVLVSHTPVSNQRGQGDSAELLIDVVQGQTGNAAEEKVLSGIDLPNEMNVMSTEPHNDEKLDKMDTLGSTEFTEDLITWSRDDQETSHGSRKDSVKRSLDGESDFWSKSLEQDEQKTDGKASSETPVVVMEIRSSSADVLQMSTDVTVEEHSNKEDKEMDKNDSELLEAMGTPIMEQVDPKGPSGQKGTFNMGAVALNLSQENNEPDERMSSSFDMRPLRPADRPNQKDSQGNGSLEMPAIVVMSPESQPWKEEVLEKQSHGSKEIIPTSHIAFVEPSEDEEPDSDSDRSSVSSLGSEVSGRKSHLSSALSVSERTGSLMSIYSDAGDFGRVSVQGAVEFALMYSPAEELIVMVEQCQDLAFGNARKQRTDPYVKTYLLPDKSRRSKRKTSIKKRTTNPVYVESLRYNVKKKDLIDKTLSLSVWHNDSRGRNVFLGQMEISLRSWDWRHEALTWYNLQPKNSEAPESVEYSGILTLALKYVPPEFTGGSKHGTGEVHVWLKEARQLRKLKPQGVDSFVKCYILPDTSKKSRQKTRVVKKTQNPIFNHAMVYDGFRAGEVRDACCELTVWDHSTLSNQFLGGVRLSLGTGKSYGKKVDWMDSEAQEVDMWEKMLSNPNSWVDGELSLRPSMTPRKEHL
ncbi:synaptotagmin-like protein 2 isoform X2 [Denticeps clupeoides]|uniref:synaptotagmin-like protein 2 isoform X2 n=1 Tax=Denticeps clupeoides TaxID=299321 RepID=UPI0010A44A6A|nr:synaptotagmin-like protein 2 isoform X2 [Denticeps clupeoides]